MNLARRHFHKVLSLFVGLLVSVLIGYLNLDYLEALLYDYRTELRPAPTVSKNIVMILVNPADVEKFKGTPGFEEHAQMLLQLKQGQPKAVVYTIPLREFRGEDSAKKIFAKEAKQFTSIEEAAKDPKASALVFQSNDFVMKGEEAEKLKMPPPLDQLQIESGPRLLDATLFAKDGVARRLMLTYQQQFLLHPKLAILMQPDLAQKVPSQTRGAFNFMDTDQIYIDFAPRNSYQQISFYEVYTRQYPSNFFKDKIVLVGVDLEDTVRHYVPTPYDRDPNGMTVTELHANALDTLLRDSAPRHLNRWIEFLLVFVIAAFSVYAILTMRPTTGLLLIISGVLTFTLVAFFAFWPFGIWIGMAAPYLAIFLCYYFLIPYRLIMENRRAWELTQKNRLLTEVEVLKSNFISMMSHDLKTPLARIQGMTDIVQREGPEVLNNKQKEALLNIRASSEDLLNFISSILNFSRIESEGVQLHLQSRDINTLVKEVSKKLEFAAKIKNIELIFELEPLFSIQIDTELIKQVISNLIENAIKYSPEGSRVLVTTDEQKGHVVLQVADQGVGIDPEDLPNIFMKFFRSKAAKSSPIKGSGLGLYLAHYFVELHQGRIYAESTPGQGSTFTVELPIKTTSHSAKTLKS